MVRLLLAALLLCACNRPPADDRPEPAGLEAGRACTLDSECRAGLICDPSRRTCVCTGHDACPAGTFCHPYTGRCVERKPGCDGDADCPAGQYCEPETRSCRPGSGFCQPCARDGECAEPGARCLAEGFCGRACTQDRDCPNRARCIEGQCRPGLRCWDDQGIRPTGHCVDECRTDEDCVDGECRLSQCLPRIGCDDLVPCVPDTFWPCERDADCVQGVDQVCESGRCVARQSGCAHSEACDPVTLACVPSCREDAECPPGRTCRSGACFPRARCQQHSQCPQGMVCACPRGKLCSRPGEEGECRPACKSDEDCPLRMVCAESLGRLSCQPGCVSDRDCGPDERCSLSSGICVQDPDYCKFTELCPTCTVCRDGSCRPARTAETPHCQSCFDDSGCGEGGVCLAGHCAVACGTEGCPSGFGCAKRQDARGEERFVCLPLDGRCDTECL